jgi:hypothetical protein
MSANTIEPYGPAYRVVNFELADAAPATGAQLSAALRWRDACDARHLVFNMLVRTAAGLAGVRQVVEHVDALSALHRDRPILRVYCMLPESIAPLVDRLAAADAKTPRLEVIRVLARPLAPPRLAQLSREAASAESAQLLFRAYLQLSSTRELAQVAELLTDGAPNPPHRLTFRRFPVVEVPGALSADDWAPIAELWSQHPRLQEASTRSLHGRIETFFRLFELVRLGRVGIELPLSSHDVGHDDGDLSAFRTCLDRSGLLTAEPHVESTILEHDVDLLADSHECQSPVFTFASASIRRPPSRSTA